MIKNIVETFTNTVDSKTLDIILFTTEHHDDITIFLTTVDRYNCNISQCLFMNYIMKCCVRENTLQC